MSFTVMRKRGGKEVPITVSIWDAFRGIPVSKPGKLKPKLCPCCQKVHVKRFRRDCASDSGEETRDNDDNTETSAHANNKRKDDVKTTNPGCDDKGTSRLAKDAAGFSAGDDAKIKEMKAAQKSWKAIAAALDKHPMSQLRDRWKTINPNREKKDEESNNTKNSKKKDNAVNCDNKNENANIAGLEKKAAEALAKAKKIEAERDELEALLKAMQMNTQPGTNKNDRTASASQNMKAFSKQYDKLQEKQKWIAAASKHYDLTGQRVTPEAARRMAEGK